jgi:branched-chain amino acid transport system substrate-binding protein
VSAAVPAAGGSPATGSTIKVGVISSDSGPAGTVNDIPVTIARWQTYTNAHGGINGHPVDLIEMNDQTNPAIALQDAQTLLNDHVIAIMDNSYVSASYAKLVDAAHVPVLSLNGANSNHIYETDPNYFANMQTPPTGTSWHIAKQLALAGVKKAAVLYCGEVAACAGVPAEVKKVAPSLGFQVVFTGAYTAAQPNYTALCLAAKSAGADGLFTVGPDPAANLRVYTDCAQQGYHPIVVGAAQTLPATVYTGESQLSPVYMGTGMLNPELHLPANAVFHSVMDSYLPSAVSPSLVAGAWDGLEMLKAALPNVGANPTSQDVYNGLYSFHDETLGGFGPPLTFKKGSPTIVYCTFQVEINHGALTTPHGSGAICP